MALDDLDIHVPTGSVYGLVGRNGAGKTTLIRVLCGLHRPTGGSYSLFGTDYKSRGILNERRRMSAMVELPTVFGSMTAQENLKMQCYLLGIPSHKEIPELLELVGLSDVGSKRARIFPRR